MQQKTTEIDLAKTTEIDSAKTMEINVAIDQVSVIGYQLAVVKLTGR